MAIYLTSDIHLGHDRQFLWGPRGFSSIDEHDVEIIKRWNETVSDEDTVYILGDLMLNDNIHGMECLRKLKGHKIVVFGNHDTPVRKELYSQVCEIAGYATMLKYKGYHFYLSHFPTITSNLEKESLKQCTLCLSGHTHSKDRFYQDMPFVYNVALDAHNCYPVSLDKIIQDMKNKVNECKAML